MNGVPPASYSAWERAMQAPSSMQSAGQRAGSGAVVLKFEDVYAEHFDFVWRAARGLGMRQANVDDVVQEVFLIVHRKLQTLESPHALKSWLFGITRRVCKDQRRSATRRGPHIELDQQREVDPGCDPQRQLVGRQGLAMVERYVEKLDEENRALFFLTLIEGLPIADAAKALGLNANTTYSRVRTLRQELQDLLSQSGASGEGA